MEGFSVNTELVDVIRVVPLPNYQLELTFTNDKVRFFDMMAYLHKKPFPTHRTKTDS